MAKRNCWGNRIRFIHLVCGGHEDHNIQDQETNVCVICAIVRARVYINLE